MWITKTGILAPTLVVLLLTSADSQQPKPTDKNKEYVCVQWSGSADYSQNQPSVCLKWELKDKPWFRRT